MPRVLPSQVVSLIDQIFPWAAPDSGVERPQIFLNAQDSGKLEALVHLVEQIPSHLMVLDERMHSELLVSIGVIQSTVTSWQMRGGEPCIEPIGRLSTLHPVALIRRALATCPDDFPAPETSELAFISDIALRNSLRLDISAANRALQNGEWKAATVLAGSIVEALLLWALQQLQQEESAKLQTATTNASGKALRQKPHADPERWTLYEFIEVAAEAGKISADTASQARLAKNFRNLIHPGRASRLGQVCDRGTALSAVAAVELVVRDLTP
jgi:hypothetical protein